MSGRVNAAGWYLSTNRELENASLPSVISEDIHNVEHYQNANPDAPPAKILYGSCLLNTRKGSVPVFFRASNMPHTVEIFDKKFTAFATKSGESMVATHGYGAVLPPMYIGGAYKTQFFDRAKDAWMESGFDIGKQEEECKSENELKTFPSTPTDDIDEPDIEKANIWTEDVVRLFKEHNVCMIERHTKPTFKGHENLRDKKQFLKFLESVQAQFEEIIVSGGVEITGVFVDDEKKTSVYSLPHNFYKELYNPNTLEFPISPYGVTELEEFTDFNVTYTDTSMHCYVQLATGPLWFGIKDNGQVEPISAVPDMNPRIIVRIGKIKEHTRLYAERMTEDPTHPLHLPNLQSFADGLLQDLGDYRMTLNPLPGILSRSQYLPYLAKTRVRVKICDEDTKRKYIDAKARKDSSTLKIVRSGRNPISSALDVLVKLMVRVVKSGKPIDDGLRDELVKVPTARRTRVRTAANDGNAYETNCVDILREYFSADESVRVIGNDVAIRRTILETDDKQYTGIDIFLETSGICIAIQCKRKERIVSSDYESFLRTLRYAREKRPSDYVHGLFVVQKMPDMNANLLELFETTSANLVVLPDNNLDQIVQRVRNVLAYYAIPTE